MIKTPKEAVQIAEPNDYEKLCGLLGAINRRELHEFQYQRLKVRRVGSSIEVCDLAGRPLGGKMLLESATINEMAEWIEAKMECY